MLAHKLRRAGTPSATPAFSGRRGTPYLYKYTSSSTASVINPSSASGQSGDFVLIASALDGSTLQSYFSSPTTEAVDSNGASGGYQNSWDGSAVTVSQGTSLIRTLGTVAYAGYTFDTTSGATATSSNLGITPDTSGGNCIAICVGVAYNTPSVSMSLQTSDYNAGWSDIAQTTGISGGAQPKMKLFERTNVSGSLSGITISNADVGFIISIKPT